jgi:vacuolar-type H+-ATPase subunit H
MTYLAKYHLAEQHAYALLGPTEATLRELEARTAHYVERLHLAEADKETLRAAHRALAAARAEIERLRLSAAEGPVGAAAGAGPTA